MGGKKLNMDDEWENKKQRAEVAKKLLSERDAFCKRLRTRGSQTVKIF